MAEHQYRRKLIEVALPLERINEASTYEKFIRHGHPNNLQQWWSRKPLASARAVLFTSLVDDPSEYLNDEAEIRKERERLFTLIEELVDWSNTFDDSIISKARLEIARNIARHHGASVPEDENEIIKFLSEYGPPFLDPFAGGGSIPLEAQRLGLRSFGSDLNPLSVLITKAMIEIPLRFENCPPVHPKSDLQKSILENEDFGVEGLVADIRFYGNWIKDKAEKRIGHLYPLMEVPQESGQGIATIVAWIWARTVTCPNPACGADMPLVSKWDLSKKKGKETWIKPVIDNSQKPPSIEYKIVVGPGERPTRTVHRGKARCIACDVPAPMDYIQHEAQSGRMWNTLIAIAGKSRKGRIYFPPNDEQVHLANSITSSYTSDQKIGTGMVSNVGVYGFEKFRDLFTTRQLVALSNISELIKESHGRITQNAIQAGYPDNGVSLDDGGSGAKAYADAVVTYLAFAFSKTLNRSCAFVPWGVSVECPVNLFSRQIIPFIWDFAESNVISGPSGSFSKMLESTAVALQKTAIPNVIRGKAFQSNAIEVGNRIESPIISTDPPYYDMIPYSDLSDFFYVWLRPILGDIYPQLFQTLLTPKTEELLADAHRYGGKEEARKYFETSIIKVFDHFRQIANSDYPLTIYYAYRQREKRGDGNEISTGWETILTGINEAGFVITATWPMRTERAVRAASIGANVLASSIVLACRPREEKAPVITQKEFLTELRNNLPGAILNLQQANIAPVDLAQAAIGPGMAIYSRYNGVLESDGTKVTVRKALMMINNVLDDFLAELEGEFDPDTRWAIAWFEQYGHDEGPFGDAETLSKAKNTSTDGLTRAGILNARGGKVRILHRDELGDEWDPGVDTRLTTWEATQYLIRALEEMGEEGASKLLIQLGSVRQSARELAYRLFSICERKNLSKEALAYNMLVTTWPRLTELAKRTKSKQPSLF